MKAELMQSHKVFSSFAAKESSLVFLNGVFQPELSRFQRLPAGVSLETRDGFTLRIPDKMVIEDIMHVVLVSDDSAEARQEFAVKVFAGISSRMNLVVHKAGDGVFNPKKIVTELRLAEGACVDYFQLEDSGVRGEFEGENHFYLKKHAVLDYLVFAAAEGVSMNRTIVEFEGEHGFFSAKGLSMLHGKSRAEHALTVNHRAPACISRQYYKTVLAGSSKAAFDSLVHVHAGASKSDSHQLNRNLLLSDFAEARSKPDLRIDNDDVAASHGSASGQLDEDEIFYLRSRGLSEEKARLVLVDGFAEEIVNEVHEKHLKAHLEDLIHRGILALVGEAK